MFSGLAPGIHVNTLASMLVSAEATIGSLMPDSVSVDHVPIAICCCIMSASVVHSFVDFVPSVFIGAPDGEDAVSILPGHRLLLRGQGMMAVRAAAIGSLVGSVAAILLAIPLQLILINGAEEPLEKMTPAVLIAAAALIVHGEFRRGNVLWGTVVFALSGVLGLACMTLPIPVDGPMGSGSIMLPLLTGLFGIPVLLETSEGGRIPRQRDASSDPVGPLPGLKGVLMGTVAGWFPGITATVGASMSAAVFPEDRPERFISTVASVGTVTSVLALVTLSVSGNGRSGTALAIGEIAGESIRGFMSQGFVLMLLSASVASLAGYWLTIASGKAMSLAVGRIRPRSLGILVTVMLVSITLILTGPWGVAILGCSIAVGMMPHVCGTGRMALTGCLILPVILFEFGLA